MVSLLLASLAIARGQGLVRPQRIDATKPPEFQNAILKGPIRPLSRDLLKRLAIESGAGTDAEEFVTLSAKRLVVPGKATMSATQVVHISPDLELISFWPTILNSNESVTHSPFVQIVLPSLKKGVPYLLVLNVSATNAKLVVWIGNVVVKSQASCDFPKGEAHVPVLIPPTEGAEVVRLFFLKRESTPQAIIDLASIEIHEIK